VLKIVFQQLLNGHYRSVQGQDRYLIHNASQKAAVVERLRKNCRFAGSDDGAQNWAVVASLVETCKLNAVDPQRYLAETLTRLVNGWKNSRIDELMPSVIAHRPHG
jgi:hypothetical protein